MGVKSDALGSKIDELGEAETNRSRDALTSTTDLKNSLQLSIGNVNTDLGTLRSTIGTQNTDPIRSVIQELDCAKYGKNSTGSSDQTISSS